MGRADGRGGRRSGQDCGARPGPQPSADATECRRETLGDGPARRGRDASCSLGAARRRPALLATHQGVDRLAHPHPGAVQQYTLVLCTDAKQFTRRLGVVALDIAKDDDGALPGGQAIDRRLDVVPKLAAGHQPFGVQLVPRTRHLQPMPVGGEAGGFAQRVLLGGQCDKADFAAAPSAGAIEHDREQPGADGRPALEPADAGENGQPGILHHLLGLGMAADDRGGDAHQRAVKAADQPAIGVGIAAPQAFEEGRIVELGAAWRHGSGHCMARYGEAWSGGRAGCNETGPTLVGQDKGTRAPCYAAGMSA